MVPFLDNVNKRSNHFNLGINRQPNLRATTTSLCLTHYNFTIQSFRDLRCEHGT